MIFNIRNCSAAFVFQFYVQPQRFDPFSFSGRTFFTALCVFVCCSPATDDSQRRERDKRPGAKNAAEGKRAQGRPRAHRAQGAQGPKGPRGQRAQKAKGPKRPTGPKGPRGQGTPLARAVLTKMRKRSDLFSGGAQSDTVLDTSKGSFRNVGALF